MKENMIKQKSFELALRTIELYKVLQSEKKEFILSKQLLKSGTSVGAMVRESEHAESKADFIHKLSVALKESNETQYWLELLNASNIIDQDLFQQVHSETTQVTSILVSILKSMKGIK